MILSFSQSHHLIFSSADILFSEKRYFKTFAGTPPYIVKHFLLEFTRFFIVPQNKDEPRLVDIPEYLVRK